MGNESVVGRVDAAFHDAGDVVMKNIDRPIRVWKWHPDNDSKPAEGVAKRRRRRKLGQCRATCQRPLSVMPD